MDIYAYAESIDWGADYYDIHTGCTYGIQQAGRMKKFFGIDAEIPVYLDGKLIGYAQKDSSDEE